MPEPKKLTVKEFREIGYLQELNRLFLHPLGLALEVVVGEDGSECFGGVWDSRDDPEGIIYEREMIDSEKALRVRGQAVAMGTSRLSRLGYVTQQLP